MLLRGINVGRGRTLRMADLRALCVDAGCESVETYIQSGNVVLRSSMDDDLLADRLESIISDHAGFQVPVVVRTAESLSAVQAHCPFDASGDTKPLLVSFVQSLPDGDPIGGVDPGGFGRERFILDGRELFMYLPDGQGRSKLAKALARTPFGSVATVRNWRTISKLVEIAGDG